MLLPIDNNKITVEGDVPTLTNDPKYQQKNFISAPCSGWICHTSTVERISEQEIQVTVSGSYDLAEGGFCYTIAGNGRFAIDYFFNIKTNINPRQIGVVFELPENMKNLSWDRKGLWTSYPKHHIGRNRGEAKAFYSEERFDLYGPRSKPAQPWSQDATEHGSNDFRSTKHNIFFAELNNTTAGLRLNSDGRHHVRC